MEDDCGALLRSVAGKRVVAGRMGEAGFDVIFENGVVIEIYDLWRIEEDAAAGARDGCGAPGGGEYEEYLGMLVGRVVVSVEAGGGECSMRFVLDGGDVVCLPPRYAYVVDVEE